MNSLGLKVAVDGGLCIMNSRHIALLDVVFIGDRRRLGLNTVRHGGGGYVLNVWKKGLLSSRDGDTFLYSLDRSALGISGGTGDQDESTLELSSCRGCSRLYRFSRGRGSRCVRQGFR